jgi:hypothetical protein
MRLRAAVLAVTSASLFGCYSYTPVRVQSVSPGETVRARLTPEAREKLPAQVRGDDGTLEGELLEQDGGGLVLFVPTVVRQEGFYAEDLHQRVVLSAADVVEVERRQLNRPRTYLAGGVVGAAVAGLAAWTLTGKTGGSTIDHTDQGPSANRIPLIRLRIGR